MIIPRPTKTGHVEIVAVEPATKDSNGETVIATLSSDDAKMLGRAISGAAVDALELFATAEGVAMREAAREEALKSELAAIEKKRQAHHASRSR